MPTATETRPELLTVPVQYQNYEYDDREWLDAAETIENPRYDPEEYHEVQKPVCYVSVYAVTRCYGGSAEGGWWYNAAELVCSVPLIEPGNAAEVETIKAFLKPRFEDEGNIYSVLSGCEYRLDAEYNRGSGATHGRPYYE